MQLLYESPGAYFLLEVTDTEVNKLASVIIEDPLKSFENVRQLQEGEIPIDLKDFLIQHIKDEPLYVTDISIKENLSKIIKNEIRFDEQITRKTKENFFTFVDLEHFKKSSLSVSHKLANNNLENVEKMDVLITETLSLYDSLDKDINLHVMRIKEWYSNHFPELQDIISTNYEYLISVCVVKTRGEFMQLKEEDFIFKIKEFYANDENIYATDEKKEEKNTENNFSEVWWKSKFCEVRKVCETSMGTDFKKEDVNEIINDCKNVLNTFRHKENISKYLEERISFLAPNFSAIVGEMVGCRLIASAGNLMNLSKLPSSTIQILGAEKRLFDALKNKTNTPKHGFIYNSPLVCNAPVKFKGQIARSLAAKAALAAKIDAFSADESGKMGKEAARKLKLRIESLSASQNKQKKRRRS